MCSVVIRRMVEPTFPEPLELAEVQLLSGGFVGGVLPTSSLVFAMSSTADGRPASNCFDGAR